ncbi:MAG: hypothetical protein JWO11_889 [Nocardioides sp.]|nr:hypothetical protein [Nocardioides sp.]
MAQTLDQLGSTMLGQLSNIVNGGDGRAPASPNSFLTWCTPGLPFDPADFDFAAGGFGAATDAEGYRRLLQQAFNFAQLVDFIPTFSAPYNRVDQEYVNRPSQQRLSHIYAEVLRFSKVAKHELTEEQQAKLDKFRKLMRVTTTEKNLVTEVETEKTVDGPVMVAYNEKLAAYALERAKYNKVRIKADSAKGPDGIEAVADWASNSELYWLTVKAAEDAWVSGGYRNEVDEMNAYIDAVTMRSLQLWKAGLLDDLDKAEQAATTPGSVFKFTTVIPGNFAHAAGWTGYAMNHEETTANTHYENESWSAGGSVNFGLWSFGADASHSTSTYGSDYNTESFRLSMELAPVVISRPWFSAEFFTNRGWTLTKGDGWFYDDFPSDGARPPKGNLIGYSTIALFARNIVVESQEFATAYQSSQSSTDVGGSVGWGPFCLSGSYSSQEGSTHFESHVDGAKVTVPGMQIIGFVNELVGKSPNPLEELTEADFE